DRRAFTLEIAGGGAERGSLDARAAARGLGEVAHFRGVLPEGEIAALVGRADVYVSTSLSDSTSVSLLEAMSAGAFPVVSDIPANHEWLVHGETALFFPPRDAEALAVELDRALGDADLRATAAARNRATVLAR